MAFLIKEQAEVLALRECQSLRSTRTHDGFRTLAAIIVFLVITAAGTLIFVPWQQSIYGKGEVTVFSPMYRPQSIQPQISARIHQWHVKEGDRVKAGQLLVSLQDIDPKFLDPQQLQRLKNQRAALVAKQIATERRIASISRQVESLVQSRGAAIPTAGIRVGQTQNRIIASQQGVTAAKQNVATAQFNFDRVKELHERGLRSTRDLELAEQTLVQTKTQLEQAEVSLTISQRDTNVAEFDTAKITADTQAAVSSAFASQASAEEALATTNSDIAKIDVEIAAMEQRITQRSVCAPMSGIVVRVMAVGPGETVKPEDVLAVVAPETLDQAVALYVSHNDAPLLAVGRPVRLQFAGWPAIQFMGWPSVAVGTFAGRVAVIDAVSDQTSNKYRVLIKPDYQAIKEGQEQAWPSSKYLRPGTETAGWVMLDTVPLWFELWRQFNAFPPTIKSGPMDEIKIDMQKVAKQRKK